MNHNTSRNSAGRFSPVVSPCGGCLKTVAPRRLAPFDASGVASKRITVTDIGAADGSPDDGWHTGVRTQG